MCAGDIDAISEAAALAAEGSAEETEETKLPGTADAHDAGTLRPPIGIARPMLAAALARVPIGVPTARPIPAIASVKAELLIVEAALPAAPPKEPKALAMLEISPSPVDPTLTGRVAVETSFPASDNELSGLDEVDDVEVAFPRTFCTVCPTVLAAVDGAEDCAAAGLATCGAG